MATAVDKAYQIIRDKVLSGAFPPGVHLKEEELVSLCGVSRTPIRDALKRLSNDYYVTIRPNQGTFVNEWAEDDIHDIFTLRSMMEGFAARRAAERISRTDVEALRDHAAAIDTVLEAEGPLALERFLEANRAFHEIITRAAASSRLEHMVARLVEQPVVARTAISYSASDLRRSNHHHWELIDALDAGDGDWAEKVMSSHILSAYRTYLRTYAERRAAAGDIAAE